VSFAAASSNDALVDYDESTHLYIFTPFISFLVVLVGFLVLLSLIAFFTDVKDTDTGPHSILSVT